MSNLFDSANKEIEQIQDRRSKNTAIVFITFLQLFITCIIYLFVDNLLNYIRPWKELVKKFFGYKHHNYRLGDLNTSEYGLHIILIILLIEMNSSLKHNLHSMAEFINITN